MTAELCLIDTDILINILKDIEPAFQKSREYLKKQEKFTISCITYYECLRAILFNRDPNIIFRALLAGKYNCVFCKPHINK